MGFSIASLKAWTFPLSKRHSATSFVFVLLLAAFLHHFIVDYNDPNGCRKLTYGGHWYNDNTWLPHGCVTEGYGWDSINRCTNGKNVIFAGDSTVQGLFWATAQKLNGDVAIQAPVQQDLEYEDDHAKLAYLWDPYLNGSRLLGEAHRQAQHKQDAASLIVVGTGRRHGERADFQGFEMMLNKFDVAIPDRRHFSESVSSSLFRAEGPGDMLLFAPVQEPFIGETDDREKLLSYREINDVLKEFTSHHSYGLMSSFTEMTADRREKYNSEGTDASNSVLHDRVNLLFALRCNAQKGKSRGFPHTHTCCGAWNGPNWIQTLFLLTGLLILPATVLADILGRFLSSESRAITRATCGFFSSISLMWVTDRTHVFEQVTRLPLIVDNLYSMIFILVMAGVCTIRRLKSSEPSTLGETKPSADFLSREQTDEWKGWMQGLIIIYHYNMAWTADWFWEIIRLTVASYLFQTGYGHTIFFLKKRDYSFRRVAAVMLRTNLVPVALAYVMRTRWLLYYYMPLSSFWFLVVYATMAIAPGLNESKPLLIGKIGISAALVHAFLNTQDLPDTVVKLFTLTFKLSFNARDFFDHRVRQDGYIVYVGMLTAIVYLWLKEITSQNVTAHLGPDRLVQRHFNSLKVLIIMISAIAFPAFFYLVWHRIHSQGEFTSWQPYITFVPILSFIVLRNAHPILRSFHSAAFAWLGRYSGEMYVMQDHLWLAGDQEAVLRSGLYHGNDTLLGDRWRDLLLITPLYLIVCCLVGDATSTITAYLTQNPESTQGSMKAGFAGPQPDVEMALLATTDADDAETALANEKAEHRPALLERARWRISAVRRLSVRNRMFVILACLWFFNVAYR